jgi:hypothetical protein
MPQRQMRQAISGPGMSPRFASVLGAKPRSQASGPASGFVLAAKVRTHGAMVRRLGPCPSSDRRWRSAPEPRVNLPRTVRSARSAGQRAIGLGVSVARAVCILPAEELAGVREVQKTGARPPARQVCVISRDRAATSPLNAAAGGGDMASCGAPPAGGGAAYVNRGTRRYERIRPWVEARLPGMYDQVL